MHDMHTCAPICIHVYACANATHASICRNMHAHTLYAFICMNMHAFA